MKRIVGLFILLFFAKNTFSQNINQNNVPAVIVNTFKLKYPNATDVKWKKDNKKYEINYRVNSKSHKLKLDYKGNIIEHLQDLYVSEIPKAVLETIKSKVPYYDIRDADIKERGNRITYEINFKLDGEMHYFWIYENGKLLKYRWVLKDNEIPKSVMNIINSYGKMDIEYAKYVEEGDKIIYIISGEMNDESHKFTINDKLQLVKHTADIKNENIPISVSNTLSLKYKDYEIRDADLLEENGTIIYILKMKKLKENIYVTLNSKGEIIKEEYN